MSHHGHDPLRLQALVDGELDAIHAAEVEAWIAACADCAAGYDRLTALHQVLSDEALRVTAPERLHRRLALSLAAAAGPSPASPPPAALVRRPRPWAWMGGGAGLAVAACFSLFMVAGVMRQESALTRDLVASHVRSLQVAHLTDVQTSDQHVVKPWFNGKLDFSPPVIELKDQGFPLVGGRLDYVDGHTVAAIVYRRGRHIINLFVWPDGDLSAPPRVQAGGGYGLRHWRAGGMSFWAVSDVNPDDLTLFAADLKSRTGG